MLARSFAAALLASLATSTPALAGDVRIEITGTVTAVTGTLPGPLQTAAVGETFQAVVEVIDVPEVISPTHFRYPTDALQGYVRVGTSQTDVHVAGGGEVNLQDQVIDAISVGAPIQGGVVIAFAVGYIDVTGMILSTPDINSLVGSTITAPSVALGSIQSLQPVAQVDLVITQMRFLPGTAPRFGTNYCNAEPNSTGFPGNMAGVGSASIAASNALLVAYSLPDNSFGFFLGSRAMGFVAHPGGSSGNLCLGGSIGRFVGPGQIMNSGSVGRIDLQLDLAALPTPTGPVVALPGDDWYFTAWYRDVENGMVTSNFTDGLEVVFQ